MIKTEINFCVFIFLSCLIVWIDCQTCHGMLQYDKCSTTNACGCLYMANSNDTAICGFLLVTCSELTSCDPLNNICYEPNHVCVQHPQCHNLPVCYPLSMSDHQICPLITPTSTTTATSTEIPTTTTTTETTTVVFSTRTTTSTPIVQNCSTSDLITFDNITTESFATIPSNFINLQWKNFSIMNLTAFPSYDSSGFSTARQSGYIAFNKNGTTMSISIDPPYVFNVYSFVAASAYQNQLKLIMLGYRGSQQWYSAMYPLYTFWPQLIELNYLNINTITFSTDDSLEFAMDNLCISISPITTTAIPTTTTT